MSDEASGDGSGAGPARTGMPAVDQVIDAVEQLEQRPIEEHVGVFEVAHEQLRRALDALPVTDDPGDAGDPGNPSDGDPAVDRA